jgi:hypothetical protein
MERHTVSSPGLPTQIGPYVQDRAGGFVFADAGASARVAREKDARDESGRVSAASRARALPDKSTA